MGGRKGSGGVAIGSGFYCTAGDKCRIRIAEECEKKGEMSSVHWALGRLAEEDN